MFPKEITRTLRTFGYFSPRDVSQVVSLLGELGDRAKILAGGTDLLHAMRLRQMTPEYLINIKELTGLDSVRENAGLEIGALARISILHDSEVIRQKYVSIYEATEWFGSPQIRNMATVGGNICRSSPSSDMIPPLIALDAVLTLVGPKGGRNVAVQDVLLGAGKTALDREILTSVSVPPRTKGSGAAFKKLMRSSQDLAKVSCAVRMDLEGGKCSDARIVLGAVADKVFRAKEAEKILRGEKVTGKVIEEAARQASREAQPITDARSTAAYRTHVIRVLVERLIKLSMERAG